MARAKSPRPATTPTKQVITMPEATSVPQIKKSPTAIATMPPNSSSTDMESNIRQRAYELYEERGYTVGFDQEDWFKAEREVLGRNGNRQQSA